jgi:serine/threonine protein kinase
MPDLQKLGRWFDFWYVCLSMLRKLVDILKLGLMSFMGLFVIGVLMGAMPEFQNFEVAFDVKLFVGVVVMIGILVYRAIISMLSDWLSDGLTRVCMRNNEPEISSVLRDYNSKKMNVRDDPVERACDLSSQYICARDDLCRHRLDVEKAIFKSKGEESTEVLEVTKLRDAAYQKYLAVSKKLLDACNSGSSLTGRIYERNKATKTCADRLFQLLDESVVDQPQDPATETKSVVTTLSLHDDWGANKLQELFEFNQFRLFPERMKEMWLANIARDYQSNVAPALKRAAWVAISELHADSMRFDVLVTAAADAKTVVEHGAKPHERVKRELKEMISRIRTVRRAVRDARLAKGDAEDDGDDYQRAYLEQQLSKEKEKLKMLQQKERVLWSDVYRLAAAAFPELPSQALESSKASGNKTLSLCDPHAARLLAPLRQFDMYEGPDGKHEPVKISSAGKHSRNDIFRAVYCSKDVCLKKFVLGLGNRDTEKVAAVRTLQREINSVAKLAHDRVIKPALFFLEAEANGSLCAYVEYPWYECGSMNKWLDSLPARQGTDSPKVRLVLWDVIKAIEHVHYHGIVHCDIKPANVLVERTSDGQHRGVLADFDLSKDLANRLQEASMSVMSVSGARGTPGCLTMAPEVLQGRQPDFKADCYSFGGMMLQALFKSESDRWQQGGDTNRWDMASGAPLLTMVKNEMARSLLSRALHRDKHRRPTSTQIVSDGFFSADISKAQDLLQDVEKRREELERKQANHSKAVREHQQHMADEEQRIAKEQDELGRRAQSRQAQLQREQEELERKERELAGQGKLNRDEQKKLQDERQRLEAECKKISKEKERCEKGLREQQQKLDQRKSEEEARLKSEKKKVEDWKRELEKKEREASKGLQVPAYWKNKSGVNFVSTKFVRDELQKFMVESACCSATKKTRVESVERVENESLWQMYQLRRDILKKTCAAQRARSLTTATNWQPAIPSKAELSSDMNEFYLFHGTSSKSARFICEHGFDERVADLNGLYGAGSYFAINSCKSHQYSRKCKDSSTFVMLVCRVVMGSPYCTSTCHNGQRRPPDNEATPGRPFDSIFAQHRVGRGGQQQHNEYVVFDRHQVYPEYIVRYTE